MKNKNILYRYVINILDGIGSCIVDTFGQYITCILISVFNNQEVVSPAITKRTIGKLIVKYCGNEGQADDPALCVTLRQILQATITKLDTEPKEVWENAEIVIYDQPGNDFCIRSGSFENKFVVQLDAKDEISIICTDRKKQGYMGWMVKPLKNMFNFHKPAPIENTNGSNSIDNAGNGPENEQI